MITSTRLLALAQASGIEAHDYSQGHRLVNSDPGVRCCVCAMSLEDAVHYKIVGQMVSKCDSLREAAELVRSITLLSTSIDGHGSVVTWDCFLTGVVITPSDIVPH